MVGEKERLTANAFGLRVRGGGSLYNRQRDVSPYAHQQPTVFRSMQLPNWMRIDWVSGLVCEYTFFDVGSDHVTTLKRLKFGLF